MKFLVKISHFNLFSAAIVLAILLFSCARMGTPSGGPRDETPPVLLRAIPDTLQTQVPTAIEQIELNFDEFVVLKDQAKNILISPPLQQNAVFFPTGTASRRVRVIFNEELLPNTTYNIYFGNAIQDNNEGNALRDFSYVFSTGDYIDSLELNGRMSILGERKLEENMLAALYAWDESYSDSIIYMQKPLYVARADTLGNFRFRYLREGEYRLIAFNDETPNLSYDPRLEKIAFHPTPVTAGDSQSFDLQLFMPKGAYRLVDAEQKGYGRIDFHFTGKPETLRLIPVEPQISVDQWVHKAFSDTASLYFNPEQLPEGTRQARMRFAVEHGTSSDTIRTVVYNTQENHQLNLVPAKSALTPIDTLTYNTTYPIRHINPSLVTVMEDTVALDFEMSQRNSTQISIHFPVRFERNYAIELIPGALEDVFGLSNDTIQTNLTTKRERDYGNLTILLRNHPPHPFWLNLYDQKDLQIRSYYGTNPRVNYRYLPPGEYYLKLLVDENEDGRHNTGDFMEQLQPEPIYIYPTNLNIRAYWDLEETWFVNDTDVPIVNDETSSDTTEDEVPENPRENIPIPSRPTLPER